MVRPTAVALLASAVLVSACRPTADDSPMTVYSSNGVRVLLEDVRPALEAAAGRPLAFEFSTATDLTRRIDGGATPDVVVLTAPLVAALGARGRVVPGSSRLVAAVGVGVGVRAGAPRADIGTPDALKGFLLGARSVVFTAEGQSRATIDAAFATLGIADRMRETTVLTGPGEAPGVVARGEAEVVLTLLSELVGVRGVDVLGPLPAGLQTLVTFAAARGAASSDPDAAGRVIDVLAGPVVAGQLARHGLSAPARQP